MEELKKQLEEKIKNIFDEQGITTANIDVIYKLIDMHKDLCNEKYWEEKIMRYRDNYRDGGNYRGDYGRRGVPGTGRRYRGDEYIEEMRESYRDYSDSGYGHGDKNEMMRSLDYMLQSVTDFIEMLKRDANSQEEIELIQKYTDRISNM